jgi:hypothetical protein
MTEKCLLFEEFFDISLISHSQEKHLYLKSELKYLKEQTIKLLKL